MCPSASIELGCQVSGTGLLELLEVGTGLSKLWDPEVAGTGLFVELRHVADNVVERCRVACIVLFELQLLVDLLMSMDYQDLKLYCQNLEQITSGCLVGVEGDFLLFFFSPQLGCEDTFFLTF